MEADLGRQATINSLKAKERCLMEKVRIHS